MTAEEKEAKRLENIQNWDEDDYNFYKKFFDELKPDADAPGASSDAEFEESFQRFQKKIKESISKK